MLIVMKHHYLPIACFWLWSLCSFSLLGQNLNSDRGIPPGSHRCGTDAHEQYLQNRFPLRETREAFERWLTPKIREVKAQSPAERAVITIPVVVHVIHNNEQVGSGDNISASQIQSQITILNQDFRRMLGTPGYNTHPDGADTEIEFCLAFVDTAGHQMAEPGIHRVSRQSLGLGAPPYVDVVIDTLIAPNTVWDPERYFNIWSVRISDPPGPWELLGYANFPTSSGLNGLPPPGSGPEADGVFVNPRHFGLSGSIGFPYHLGRTATHEVGHFLGLLHLWGTGGCNSDDYCMDTPNASGPNFSCSNNTSCGSRDMVENYMDYTDDACFNIFTEDQKARMRAVLQNSPRRKELVNSTVCQVPSAQPIPGFLARDTVNCDGLVHFRDTSQEIPTDWLWYFGDGDSSLLRNPTHSYDSSGTYAVTLIVSNMIGTDTLVLQIQIFRGYAPTIDAGRDTSVCQGDSLRLMASVMGSASSIHWTSTGGLQDSTGLSPFFIGGTSQPVYVTASDSLGCSNSDSLYILVHPSPTLQVGADVQLCRGDSVQLQVVVDPGAMVSWQPTMGLRDSLGANPWFVGGVSQAYSIQVMNNQGCRRSDSLQVEVLDPPFIDAGPDLAFCEGMQTRLGIAILDTSLQVLWFPGTGLDDSTLSNPLFTAWQSQGYQIQVTDSSGCVNQDSLFIHVQPLPEVNAGPDRSINLAIQDTVHLSARSLANIVAWEWLPTDKLITANTLANPISQPDVDIAYQLKGTDSLGCAGTDSIRIEVLDTRSNDPFLQQKLGAIAPPFPNPVFEELSLSAEFHQSLHLEISLCNVQGQVLAQVFRGKVRPGSFAYVWRIPRVYSSGLYLIRWQSGALNYGQKIWLR